MRILFQTPGPHSGNGKGDRQKSEKWRKEINSTLRTNERVQQAPSPYIGMDLNCGRGQEVCIIVLVQVPSCPSQFHCCLPPVSSARGSDSVAEPWEISTRETSSSPDWHQALAFPFPQHEIPGEISIALGPLSQQSARQKEGTHALP